jgi:hypothetical protein
MGSQSSRNNNWSVRPLLFSVRTVCSLISFNIVMFLFSVLGLQITLSGRGNNYFNGSYCDLANTPPLAVLNGNTPAVSIPKFFLNYFLNYCRARLFRHPFKTFIYYRKIRSTYVFSYNMYVSILSLWLDPSNKFHSFHFYSIPMFPFSYIPKVPACIFCCILPYSHCTLISLHSF